MSFLRRYWTSVLILFAVVLSFVFARSDAANRQEALSKALVVACKADSQRMAMTAAGFNALANRAVARRSKGDAKAARRYRAISTGITTLIPAVVGGEGNPRIAEVVLIDEPGAEPRLVITKEAKRLQNQGCRDFYGVG